MIPGWLVHGDLPPTGNRVILSGGDSAPPEFPGYVAHWVQSGTAALALALLTARSRRPQLRNPSVILPAYGCPDLIAAAEYAGVTPVLVDIGIDDPGYDLDCLAAAIDADTIAVVAVNFLGLRERLGAIRELLRVHPDVLLIEDNAQWYPEPARMPALAGDLVCLSFGRGKPVSLLGGGALLIRTSQNTDIPAIQPAPEAGAALAIKAQVFNAVLNRRLYALVNRNPLFELGKTVFKPLEYIQALDTRRSCALSAAAARHVRLSRWTENAWARVFAELSLPERLSVDPERCGRLLRYPILCRDRAQRDRLWQALDAEGLGVSAMYRVALPEVSGVAGKFRLAGDCVNARDFADRLLTLPVHEGVTHSDIDRTIAVIDNAAVALR